MNLVNEISCAQREEYFKETFTYSLTPDSQQESEVLIHNLLSLVALPIPSRVLVAPCLEGNHCIALAKKGMKVTGCAEHISSLNTCKNREDAAHLEIEWVLSDLSDYLSTGTYNLILCLDYMFGSFEDEGMNKKILSNFYKSLVPGGKVIFQLMGRDLIEKYFHPKYWVKLEENCFLMNERHLDLHGWLQENFFLLKEGNIKDFHYGQRIYYPEQFTDILKESGFKNVHFFGDSLGNPYNDCASALFAAAEKLSEVHFIRC